ncbi:hypothetical protein DFS34DRAFT_433546 [Phlyctochytrium arcticum]|nr:hypothetical protein DFS34DRAFT_433546 [Phlyctochytrium arcticum]
MAVDISHSEPGPSTSNNDDPGKLTIQTGPLMGAGSKKNARDDNDDDDKTLCQQTQLLNEPVVAEPDDEEVNDEAAAEEEEDVLKDLLRLSRPIDFAELNFERMSPQTLERLYIASVKQSQQSASEPTQDDELPTKSPRNSSTPSLVPTRNSLSTPPLVPTRSSSTSSIPSSPTTTEPDYIERPTMLPSPTNGLSWTNHPTAMNVRIERIYLASVKAPRNLLVRFAFRHRKVTEGPAMFPDGVAELKARFELTYHSLLFDHLKLDVFEGGFMGSHVGRAHVRLSALTRLLGTVIATFQLNHRKAHKSPKLGSRHIGEITIAFDFIQGRKGAVPLRSASASASVQGSRSTSTSSGGPLSPALPTRSYSGSSASPYFSTDSGGETRTLHDSPEPSSPSRSDNDDGSNSPLPHTLNRDDSRSMISFKTYSSSESTPSTTRSKPGLIAESTLMGLKELSELFSTFFGTGWKIDKMQFARALLFLQKYYSKYYPNERTNDIVTDERHLRVACYFLNYAMAAYGSLLVNYFGYGKGFMRDFFRPKMDSKTAREHLGLAREDMLVWDFDLKLFKPQFFIARDPKLNAIVVTIRGTGNIHECITDACAEYEPFSHGYAHRGFLRCAQYLETHFIDKIKAWVAQYRCKALYLTAHSLGAGVSSLFTMILVGHLPELRIASGFPGFQLKCYNIATAPCVNAELCQEFEPYIENYVNENDIVPRSSFGAIMDFRHLIISAHGLLGDKKMSGEDRMSHLRETHDTLLSSNQHPKVFIPGQIYYLYKTSRIYPTTTKKKSPPTTTTNNPLIDDPTPHYLLERSRKELFCNIQFKPNFMHHHFPNKYDRALRQVKKKPSQFITRFAYFLVRRMSICRLTLQKSNKS